MSFNQKGAAQFVPSESPLFGHLHNTHKNMRTRCYNKNSSSFHNYGGKGIRIVDEILPFEDFVKWAKANGYKTGMKLVRLDPAKDYEPSNLKWVDPKDKGFT